MFRLVSQLKFCGVNITDEEMLEKTYSTFRTSHITLQTYGYLNLPYRKVKVIKLGRVLILSVIFTKVDEDEIVKEVISN